MATQNTAEQHLERLAYMMLGASIASEATRTRLRDSMTTTARKVMPATPMSILEAAFGGNGRDVWGKLTQLGIKPEHDNELAINAAEREFIRALTVMVIRDIQKQLSTGVYHEANDLKSKLKELVDELPVLPGVV